MPTDELLHDDDMDRALRDLLPAMPRSAAREAAQRDELLMFIDTGHRPAARARPPVRDAVLVSVESTPARRRSRVVLLAFAAAAAAALVAGLLVAPRWRGQEVPGTAPTPSPRPSAPAPSTEPMLPDLFPILPASHPLADQSTAMYGGMMMSDPARTAEALIAIDEGAQLRDGLRLSVYAEVTGEMFPGARRVEFGGVTGRLFTDGGTPQITTFVTDGVPALAVEGVEVATFVEAAGGVPIVNVRFAPDGSLMFDVGALPDGYRMIVDPGPPGQRSTVNATTNVPDGDNGDGISVWVEARNPLLAYATVGDLERIDVNGIAGWQLDRGPGSTVIWQVSETTWAMIGGAMSIDDALDLARAVEFVDRATWEQRYGVVLGDYPPPEQVEAPQLDVATDPTITGPLVSPPSEEQLVETAITVPTDLPDMVPVPCNGRRYTDAQVVSGPIGADPEDALRLFLDTRPTLIKSGYEDLLLSDTGVHRYEGYNELDELVTVVWVEPVDGGWSASRVQSSPC